MTDLATLSCFSWSMAKQWSWTSKDFAITSISFEVKAGFVLLEICFCIYMEKTYVIPMLTALTQVVCDFLVSIETLKAFVNLSLLGKRIPFYNKTDAQTVTPLFLTFSKIMKNGTGNLY